MRRTGFLTARRGVESGSGVGLFALHTGLRRPRINGSRVTLDSRFDTPIVEAEGVPP